MAVDILELVKFHVKPALSVDTTLEGDLPTLINAQTALQGWVAGSMTDQQSVYVAATTLEALIPRLALIFTEEVQERRAGPETTKLPNRAEFFRVLRLAIDSLKATAAAEAGVVPMTSDAATQLMLDPWPGIGVAKWGT